MQDQTISKWNTDDNKSKYSEHSYGHNQISKKIYEQLYMKEATSEAAATEFLSKTSNRNKKYKERFKLCEAKISLVDIIKSISFHTNN